jgi:hypothetical protein
VKATNAGTIAYKAAKAVTKSVVISKHANAITFTAPSNMTFGDDDQELAASEDGGITVLDSTTKTVCTVVDGALHIVKAGTCKVKATNAGNDVFLAATYVLHTVTIAKAENVITITSEKLADATSSLAVGYHAIAATSTAGTAVSVRTSSTSVCSYSATTGMLRIIRTTTPCVVTFSNVTSTNYLAATSVVRTVN